MMNSLLKGNILENGTAMNFLWIDDGVKCGLCVVSRKKAGLMALGILTPEKTSPIGNL
jgi:hypothetical protein